MSQVFTLRQIIFAVSISNIEFLIFDILAFLGGFFPKIPNPMVVAARCRSAGERGVEAALGVDNGDR